MHLPEVREEVGVVAPEVRKEFGVFIEPEELTDDLDSQYFRVTERGSESALSEAPEVLESVIYEAEDRDDDEGALRSIRRPPLRRPVPLDQHRA